MFFEILFLAPEFARHVVELIDLFHCELKTFEGLNLNIYETSSYFLMKLRCMQSPGASAIQNLHEELCGK